MRIKILGRNIFEIDNAPVKAVPVKPNGLPVFENMPSPPPRPSAAWEYAIPGRRLQNLPYDGEKNLGELGPIRRYVLDHDALRLRSWQLYLESEICQTVIKRFSRWVIGSGLKLQAEPQKDMLATEKIDIEPEELNRVVESRFRIFSNSKIADYSNQRNLHAIANEAFINSLMGGDVLVLLRFIKGDVKVQLIDGAHVSTPIDLTFNGADYVTASGNRVRNGIELDGANQHIAYYVRRGVFQFEWERITARGSNSGALMAFMVYGLKYRLDNVRGIPLLAAVFETVKKMERYKEAMLGSAEERVKIPYFIKHGKDSTGENPVASRASLAYDYNPNGVADLPTDINGKQLANQVAASANKTVYNMPVDSEIVSLEADNELYFKDFYTINIDLVCATVDIPPNVAMSKYESNFSASRAALKDWEHTLNVERKRFSDQFYAPIYWFWLETQILQNKIQAPGYLTAMADRNTMALEAYRFARFVGANVPHIDPEKEVRAERLKLGDLGGDKPLTTLEAATEALNGGDYNANVKQFAREMTEAKELGIEPPAPPPANPEEPNNKKEKKEE
jgi:capsid protein